MGKTIVFFLVERVFLLVHSGFMGVHSGNVNRRVIWYKREVFWSIWGVFWYVFGDFWYKVGGGGLTKANRPPRRMREKCVCCVARSIPPSQFVLSVKSAVVMKVLTRTFVGPMLFVKYNTNDILCYIRIW